MWKTINSPFVITIMIVVALISYNQLKKDKIASEIRAAYNELLSITEDAKDDLERKKLIEGFVKEAGKQVKDAFGSFNSEESEIKQAEENKIYFETKKLVEVSPPKIIENNQFSKLQKIIIYKVKNGSSKHLSKIAHNIELYNKDELVAVRDEWGNVKLAPGESKSYSYNGSNNEIDFDNVKISVYEIAIMNVAN